MTSLLSPVSCCMPSNCRMMFKIICLSLRGRCKHFRAMALTVSSRRISIASASMSGGFLPRSRKKQPS
jgi:hypothetical protein